MTVESEFAPDTLQTSKSCAKAGWLGRRALFVLPSDAMGGAERLTISLVKSAATNQVFHDIDVFVLAKNPTGTLEYLKNIHNVSITHAHAHREYGALVKFSRFVRSRKYDFVFSTHTHVNALCCVLRNIGILRTKKLVTRESSSIFEFDCGKFNFIIQYLVRCYGSQDLLIHQTEYMRSSFNRHTNGRLREKCRVEPNPIDFVRIEQDARVALMAPITIPDHSINVVWCGRLVEFKRPLIAIETIRRLKEQGVDHFHLMIVGDGPLMPSLRDAVEEQGLSEQITFCGHLNNPWSIMSRCDVGLLTSETEGFPNVVLEMLACGVRGVVTTNCAGDLDSLPGIYIAKEPSVGALAALLVETAARPQPAGVSALLRRRSPEAFLRTVAAGE